MKSLMGLSRLRKKILAVLVDCLCLPLCFLAAVWLRYEGLSIDLLSQYLVLIAATPFLSIPIFIRLGLYHAVIRYIDHKFVHVVVISVSCSVVGLATLAAFTHTPNLSRAVFATYWVGAIMYVVVSRFFARSYILYGVDSTAIQVVIYGAGKAGSRLASALRDGPDYSPVAFIDDKKELQNAMIAGIKVYRPDALPDLIVKKGIKEVLLAMPSLSRSQQKRILERLEPLRVKIKVTPPIGSLVNSELRLLKVGLGRQNLREIELEDLLGRDTASPDQCLLAKCITGKSVLVTGAGGSIGSELCRQLIQQRPARLILLEMSEFALYSIQNELTDLIEQLQLDIELMPFLGSTLEQEKCQRILSTFSVDTIYHAAAYKHVPIVEHNPIAGIRNNVFGTLSIAQAAIVAQVKWFVLISTDKAVRPTNVMGATKRLAELILQALSEQNAQSGGTRFSMVRFGNVLGSSGSVVPLFREQIMAGGPITLTHPEITRYFMTIPEAAQLVLQAGAMGEGGDVFLLDMGEPVKIMDLAKRMVHLSGLEVKSDLSPEGTIEIKHVGLRPGEKLFEELLIGSNVEGTAHPLIMRAQEAAIPWFHLEAMLKTLDQACNAFDYEEVRTLLMHIVVEYAPQCGIEDLMWHAGNKRPALAPGTALTGLSPLSPPLSPTLTATKPPILH
jgi:FlaA1/EpsC-like NDP-sugar epimerase